MKLSKDKKNIIILGIAVTIVLIILGIILGLLKIQDKPVDEAKLAQEYEQNYNNDKVNKLASMTETQRMKNYLSDFINKVEKKDYKAAYEILYSDFKKNYFETLTDFENYCKQYFPAMFGLTTNNMERLNNIYVLETKITDLVNANKEFEIYFVIRENALNDYDLSFSVNSAMNS